MLSTTHFEFSRFRKFCSFWWLNFLKVSKWKINDLKMQQTSHWSKACDLTIETFEACLNLNALVNLVAICWISCVCTCIYSAYALVSSAQSISYGAALLRDARGRPCCIQAAHALWRRRKYNSSCVGHAKLFWSARSFAGATAHQRSTDGVRAAEAAQRLSTMPWMVLKTFPPIYI